MALPKAGVGLQRVAGEGAQRLGGGVRALQVTGVDGGKRLVGQRLRGAFGLPAAPLIQGDVHVALQPGVGVPGGFAVANGNEAGGLHGVGQRGISILMRRGPAGGSGKPRKAASSMAGTTTSLSRQRPSWTACVS